MNPTICVKLRYEICLEVWGNAIIHDEAGGLSARMFAECLAKMAAGNLVQN